MAGSPGARRSIAAQPHLLGVRPDALGVDLAATGAVRTGPVGVGTGRLMRQRAAIDFAVSWLARNRRTEDA
ncbi:AAC(3) family N-acetyltransferase [Micromonospora tarensis]|uniref:AAC(3) family N-acetyltransferase n=1 Tax=Micromonospora tarensis TaxID=2806100 RepID=UPI001EE3BB4B|nr:AAC(3) family N-acetyltransferase [Micromonospora tarensis]